MKTKTRLTLGVGTLFLLIVLLAGLSVYHITRMRNDTQRILVANYHSLEYVRGMFIALDDTLDRANGLTAFAEQLDGQRANVTEQGEAAATRTLTLHFLALQQRPTDTLLPKQLRHDLYTVMQLNMAAIDHKSEKAKVNAEHAVTWITITGTFCFLVAFVLLINVPRSLSKPIQQLSDGIRRIGEGNYDERVEVEQRSEFREVAERFNGLSAKLRQWEHTNVAKLLFEKRRIETIIGAMHDPVVVLDETGTVLFTNIGASQILGIPPGSAIGKRAGDIALTNDLMRQLLQDLPEAARRSRKQPMTIFADGRESYFEKETVAVIGSPAEEPALLGHVIVLKNITTQKELDLAKTTFIATVSHELKTPIASILMCVDLLRDARIGAVNEEQRQLLDTIHDDSQRLLKITGELVQMTQVETGRVKLTLQPSDPHEILRYAIAVNKSAADHRGSHIVSDVALGVPPVLADGEKAAWTLTNLIGNALRYSNENAEVTASVRHTPEHVEFAVQDHGPGIDQRYAERVFDRYFRIPGTNTEGTGLGLAICKEFIEAMGGTIGVTSALGQGSRFWFRLPVAPPPKEA